MNKNYELEQIEKSIKKLLVYSTDLSIFSAHGHISVNFHRFSRRDTAMADSNGSRGLESATADWAGWMPPNVLPPTYVIDNNCLSTDNFGFSILHC